MSALLVNTRKNRPNILTPNLTAQIRSWSSLLASESRDPAWVQNGYVMPRTVNGLLAQLRSSHGVLIGLVGYQGVGKSSALLALKTCLHQTEPNKAQDGCDTVLFKWRRSSDLFKTLLENEHELSSQFIAEYKAILSPQHLPRPLRGSFRAKLEEIERRVQILRDENPRLASVEDEEKRLGERKVERLRRSAWQRLLSRKHTIFLDMPDYSKTDRRLMARDLEEIYWLWNSLNRSGIEDRPNLVIAIQKEMFHGHFFLDKMQKVDLIPMQPDVMVEAYRRRFNTLKPFTQDAILTLARMSHGIFRRYLRYVTLTLNLWETKPGRKARGDIDVVLVKGAVTAERLAEDMELELGELFPKHSELRMLAVRVLMYLEEHGSQKQGELANRMGVEAYVVSRLLGKLEAARYVTRTRDGADKLVALRRPNE